MASTDSLPVVIHSTPGCQQCKATERRFKDRGVKTTTVHLADHPDVAERLKADGILSAPYVVVPFEYGTEEVAWVGFRPDLIDKVPALV